MEMHFLLHLSEALLDLSLTVENETIKIVENDIMQTLTYFRQFKYAPNLVELHTFLSTKISKKNIVTVVDTLEKKGKIASVHVQTKVGNSLLQQHVTHTVGGYTNVLSQTKKKYYFSLQKKRGISKVIHMLSWLPQIKLIGYSGSVAMENANEADDIDLFIITAQNRLWTARFFSLLITQFFGRRRKRGDKHARDKVCLNMFVDENDLRIPHPKRNKYIAHEILQMKPILNRSFTYENFLKSNKWVFRFFPNASKYYIIKHHNTSKHIILSAHIIRMGGNLFEQVVKRLQRLLIDRHRTTERISNTQLWFFPRDYEKNIKV
jgi:hypothetical protein